MAKGDFIHSDPDTSSYASADFRGGRVERDVLVAGVTLLFLFVTIRLRRKMMAPQPAPGAEADPNAEQVCVCSASITDYSLQGNIYVDKNVAPGDPATGVMLHELYHLLHHKNEWTAHKAELDTLLDGKRYGCSDESKSLIVQDVFAWFVQVFYGDQKAEERDTKNSSQALQGVITATNADQQLDAVFGKERLKENKGDAKADKDLPVRGRFESRVIVTWDGSCAP